MTEQDKLLDAILASGAMAQRSGDRLAETKPDRAAELWRVAGLRRSLVQAVMNKEEWTRDVDRVHARLTEIHRLMLSGEENPVVPRELAEQHVLRFQDD